MHFQVRTDNHIPNTEELTDRIRDEVEGPPAPGSMDCVRRVEVYLQEDMEQRHKKGVDTRCSIEVSLAGHAPVAVDDRATTIDDAVRGAVDKAVRALDHMLDRLTISTGRNLKCPGRGDLVSDSRKSSPGSMN